MRPGVHSPRRHGFTLLETLVAGAVFFIAVVGISLLSVRGATNASQGMRYAQTARLATQELERWSMIGYWGLQAQALADGGFPYAPAAYAVSEQTDGGGKQYDVQVSVQDTSGPPGLPTNLPPPQLGTGSIAVLSYFITVQVTARNPVDAGAPIAVTQASYVSPN